MKKLTPNDPETQSPDLVAQNLAQLKALFPELVTEGKDGVAVNLDVLKQLVGDQTVTDAEEKYGLNWHGKRRARQLALTPSTGTLRPCPQDSVDWDTTQNLMIEGDNLEVLKLLQKSYAGKVKLIYIDPPYNTGKDFVYPDNFQDNIKNYLELTGQVEGGRKISSNTEASGRFHTDWLNMMYPRLKLAQSLLTTDGVLLISIDDQELNHLISIVDELFGFNNRKVIAVKMSESSGLKMGAVKKFGVIPKLKEYVVLVKKDGVFGLPIDLISKDKWDTEYNIFLSGMEKEDKAIIDEVASCGEITDDQISMLDKLLAKITVKPVAEVTKELGLSAEKKDEWLFGNAYRICQCATSSTVLNLAEQKKAYCDAEFFFVKNKGGDTLYLVRANYNKESSKPRVQMIFAEDNLSIHPGDFWVDIKTTGLEAEGGVEFKNGKKPIKLLQRLIKMSAPKGGIVVDFFAGSGSTGEAVWRTNTRNASLRFFLVQLPEPLSSVDKEQKSTFDFCVNNGLAPNVASITKERLRRAGKKIRGELEARRKELEAKNVQSSLLPSEDNNFLTPDSSLLDSSPDLGFRVFKLDSSNIRAWNPDPADLKQTLFAHQDHLVEGRTESDILFELLLKLGLDLCVRMEKLEVRSEELEGKSHTIHAIGGGVLLACLSEKIGRKDVESLGMGIVEWHKEQAPAGESTVVFRDSAFADDVAKTNLAAILHQHGIGSVRSL